MSQNQITDSVSLINFIKIHLSLSIFFLCIHDVAFLPTILQ